MLARIRKAMEEKDEGFTLIELLVVIIIIGILAAIAIPVYLNQRNKGYDSAAKADLKALGTMQEAFLTDNAAYADYPTPGVPDFKKSAGVKIAGKANGAQGFCLVAESQSGKFFVYDSNAGGIQTATASTFATVTYPTGGSCATAAPTTAPAA
jgi:type IV pilus assembly protein PilA